MALSLTEIHKIQHGIIRPEAMTLFEMTVLMAKRHALFFIANMKVTGENQEASAYQTKMEGVCNAVTSNNNSAYQNLLSIWLMKAGDTAVYATIKGYTDGEWETLIQNNMPIAFEVIAGTTQAEKNAWNGL